MSDRALVSEIVPVAGAEDMERVRALFREYQDWLGFDLCFQGFEEELASLPGRYAPPHGGLWFARRGTEIGGVVGLRPMDDEGRCEMKRLWVRPGFRGLSFGRRLADTVVAAARVAGYRTICLDTLPMMTQAHALYDSLGFRECAPYYHNPIEGTVYMELDLVRSVARSG